MKEIQALKILREFSRLKGLMQILVFLYNHGGGTDSDFTRDLRLNHAPTYKTLEHLIECGAVEVDETPRTDSAGTVKSYMLTEIGRKLAAPVVALFEDYRAMRGVEIPAR